jgi:hypothetical protein
MNMILHGIENPSIARRDSLVRGAKLTKVRQSPEFITVLHRIDQLIFLFSLYINKRITPMVSAGSTQQV